MRNPSPKLGIGEFMPRIEDIQMKQDDDFSLSISTRTKIKGILQAHKVDEKTYKPDNITKDHLKETQKSFSRLTWLDQIKLRKHDYTKKKQLHASIARHTRNA